jgi:hypothetical protein
MTTFLIIRGIDPVEVQESFNLVRQRVNEAVTGTQRDGSKADDKVRNRPLHKLTFKTLDGGRIAPVPENILAVGSDEERDVGGEDDE